MSTAFSLRSFLRPLAMAPLRRPSAALLLVPQPPRSPFTTTARLAGNPKKKKPAPPVGGGKGKGRKPDARTERLLARQRRAAKAAGIDAKTAGLMKFLYAPSQTSAPLRMARNRHLRHRTIHRAWMLFRRKREEARERDMARMQASMKHACEVLRKLRGPGTRPKGYLYRRAMEKTGVWRCDAVPIEYARPMVETPGHQPWNHDWKRA